MGYCNVTATSNREAQCFDLKFGISGSYALSFVMDHDSKNSLKSGNVKIKVESPPVIKDIVVNSGEKTETGLKAILQIDGISKLFSSYSNLSELLICEVYDDNSLKVYDSPVELLDKQSDLVTCEAKCDSVQSPSKSSYSPYNLSISPYFYV